jgi:hypothetical protein
MLNFAIFAEVLAIFAEVLATFAVKSFTAKSAKY